MERVTPSKQNVPAAGDDHTEVGHPAAPESRSTPFDEDATLAAVPSPPTPTIHKAGAFSLEPGSMLGEYKIEGKIGEGGMGTVFAAVHPVIGKRAAIKVLRKDLCEDPYSVERFMDEARVVNQIGHPNIVDVFAFGEMLDGRHYLVMEYLRGETLRARLERSPHLDLQEICAILRTLARALEAAHGKGVIHRDLKPDNIFLVELPDEPPRVKLLDFGIAKLAREDHRVSRTATGAMVGTPQYIAPEQAKGHAIDANVDTYALGGITFEMVTGRPPFIADNAMEIVAKHLMEAPPRPSQLAKIPRELDDLIVSMLAKDPKRRPSLTQVCSVVDRLRASPVTPTPMPVPRLSSAPVMTAPEVPVAAADAPREFPRAPSHAVTQALTSAPSRGWGGVALILAGMVAASAVAFILVSGLTTTVPPVDPAPVAASESPPEPVPKADQIVTPPPPPPPAPRPEPPPEAKHVDAKPPPPTKHPDPRPIAKRPEPKPAEIKRPPEPKPAEIKRPEPKPAEIKRPPEPKPKPEPEPVGRLRVTVHGADRWNVLVDGTARGSVSGLSLAVGSHTVTVKLPNQGEKTYHIEIDDGATRSIDVWDDKGLLEPGSTTPKKGSP